MKIFDAHFHIVDARYPLVRNQGYLPPIFTVEDYHHQMNGLDLVGGVIVSGSFQAFDQKYLVDALSRFGDNYFGVANISTTMSDSELNELDKAGVRAVRFNLM